MSYATYNTAFNKLKSLIPELTNLKGKSIIIDLSYVNSVVTVNGKATNITSKLLYSKLKEIFELPNNLKSLKIIIEPESVSEIECVCSLCTIGSA